MSDQKERNWGDMMQEWFREGYSSAMAETQELLKTAAEYRYNDARVPDVVRTLCDMIRAENDKAYEWQVKMLERAVAMTWDEAMRDWGFNETAHRYVVHLARAATMAKKLGDATTNVLMFVADIRSRLAAVKREG